MPVRLLPAVHPSRPAAGPRPRLRRCLRSVALPLASVKLDDDVRDTRGACWPRLGRWFLGNNFVTRPPPTAPLPWLRCRPAPVFVEHHALEVPGRSVPLEELRPADGEAFGEPSFMPWPACPAWQDTGTLEASGRSGGRRR